MKEQLLQLALTDKPLLGQLRSTPQLQAAVDGEWIWLRGIKTGVMPKALQQLPAFATYQLDAEGQLFPLRGHTPTARLKPLNWQDLSTFLPVELPPSALPAEVNAKVDIKLVASESMQQGEALLCTLAHWKAYAETAAQARLQPLRFAISEEAQVLIIGQPLPPLPGREYWRRDQLLLPAGFDLELPVLSELIHTDQTSLLLFDEEGGCQKIALETIVPATRSGIRLSPRNE